MTDEHGRRGVEIRDRNMAGTRFDNVNLTEAHFHNVNLRGARLDNVNFCDVRIDNAKIDGLTIYGYDIHELLQPLLRRDAGKLQ